jgi:Protein of unknown function (DUF983)
MNSECPHCGLKFEREPGYYLGSVYINYGLTALLLTIGYFTCFFTEWLTGDALLWSATAFCILFPLWFFRYARSLWLGFDVYFDPPGADDSKRAKPQPNSVL